MKKIIPFILLLLFSISAVSAQSSAPKNNPVGKWKFEAPYAPEGFTSGTMDIGFADEKYSMTMVFTGSEYKISGGKVKFENDTVSFVVFIEGTDVTVTLKMGNGTKMTGKAVYSEGEVPLSLTREVVQQK